MRLEDDNEQKSKKNIGSEYNVHHPVSAYAWKPPKCNWSLADCMLS